MDVKFFSCVAAISLVAGTSRADFVLGSWQTGQAEGWIDNGNSLAITDPANASRYSFVAAGVPGYAQSLQINTPGFNTDLRLNLETVPGAVSAFLANHLLSFTFSAPAAGAATAGYSQIYGVTLNASGYGYNNIPWSLSTATGNTVFNQSGMPNYYYYPNSPFETQTVTIDYSSLLPSITATPSNGYIQIIFNTNTGGGAPANQFLNQVVLSGAVVPEPTTAALLASGAIALLVIRRRISKK